MRKKTIICAVIACLLLACYYVFPLKYLNRENAVILMYGRGVIVKSNGVIIHINEKYMKDITTDGDYLYYITGEKRGKYGDSLNVFDLSKGHRLKTVRMPDKLPWEIDCGDVDGDGTTDILVLMYKKTIFDPVMDNRPFVYSFDGHLYAKWLGSRLSHPILDARLADIDGNGISELVSLEHERNGKEISGVYEWDYFGFVLKNIEEKRYFK